MGSNTTSVVPSRTKPVHHTRQHERVQQSDIQRRYNPQVAPRILSGVNSGSMVSYFPTRCRKCCCGMHANVCSSPSALGTMARKYSRPFTVRRFNARTSVPRRSIVKGRSVVPNACRYVSTTTTSTYSLRYALVPLTARNGKSGWEEGLKS